MVSAGKDVLWAFSEAQEEYLAILREQKAEYEADMRQYMNQDYGY